MDNSSIIEMLQVLNKPFYRILFVVLICRGGKGGNGLVGGGGGGGLGAYRSRPGSTNQGGTSPTNSAGMYLPDIIDILVI